MKNKIFLKWSKSDDIKNNNFGDDLAPYIIEKLSGKQIIYVRYASNRLRVVYYFFRDIFWDIRKIKYFKDFIISLFIKEYIISIGSILQWYGSKRCIVWGAGLIDSAADIRKSSFLAVRGKYTNRAIRNFGYMEAKVLGDPALLLPLVYKPRTKSKTKLGIIPHYIHFEYVNKIYASSDIKVINLNQKNVENIIEEITSCSYTISTSLHGLIVSHAYGIKSIWFNIDNKPLAGDNIKFIDYFSSVGIPNYKPFSFDSFSIISKNIDVFFKKNENISNIKVEIRDIQTSLINIAPFKIKKINF